MLKHCEQSTHSRKQFASQEKEELGVHKVLVHTHLMSTAQLMEKTSKVLLDE